MLQSGYFLIYYYLNAYHKTSLQNLGNIRQKSYNVTTLTPLGALNVVFTVPSDRFLCSISTTP